MINKKLMACLFFPVLLVNSQGFCQKESYVFGYSFSHPLKTVLPAQLNEISGICRLNEKEIACVQDELKYIYILDAATGNIIKQYDFFKTGDYEGITKTDSVLYMLRSDGVLTEVKALDRPTPVNTDIALALLTINNEGLCYDRDNNRLLIAGKSKALNSTAYEQKRIIYSVDLQEEKKTAKVLFTVDVNEILERALEKGMVTVDTKKKGRKADAIVRFNPSEIGIHPLSKEIYILSSTAKMLIVVNEKGALLHLEKLDAVLFNKPEGLTFSPGGDLYISNEAQGKQASLLKFTYTATKR